MRESSPVVQIANALALAGGAFTALTSETVEGMTECSVWVKYTQGAAGGTPTVRVAWTALGAANTPTSPGTQNGVVIQGGLNLVAEDWILANPGTSPYSRVLVLTVPPGAATCEISVAESGVVGTPGTVSAWFAARE